MPLAPVTATYHTLRTTRPARVAVVVPCYRARDAVCDVVRRIPGSVERIYVVDDACPEGSGARVEGEVADPRVRVLRNERNLGVGGAVKRGYVRALEEGMDIVVKIDGDGQMDPEFLPLLIRPLLDRRSDYAKGNRFALASRIPSRGARAGGERPMPLVRLVGNNALSFLHKAVTGYWDILDPANGYTAVHRSALEVLDLRAVADGYFFETDMLFQLNLVGAVVTDVPLPAVYAGEQSSLRVRNLILPFPRLFALRLARRVGVRYFVHDFNVASLQMMLGTLLLIWGIGFGAYRWIAGARGALNTAGTVMLAALPFSMGFQLLLAAVLYDIAHVPRDPLSRNASG